MKILFGICFLFGPFVFAASSDQGCDFLIRDGSFRALPQFGRPKESRVDYKLINQTLMSLHRAIRRGDPLPEGFSAKSVPVVWADSPISGVSITGVLQEPHRLAGQLVHIVLQREGVALIATVFVEGAKTKFEKAIAPEKYSEVFPFQPPSGHGGLLSVVHGVQINTDLDGWVEMSVEQ